MFAKLTDDASAHRRAPACTPCACRPKHVLPVNYVDTAGVSRRIDEQVAVEVEETWLTRTPSARRLKLCTLRQILYRRREFDWSPCSGPLLLHVGEVVAAHLISRNPAILSKSSPET